MADRGVVVGAMHAIRTLVFLLLVTAPASADALTPTAHTPAGPSVDDLQQLLDTLKDDKARAQFVRQLQTMIEARHASGASQPTTSSSTDWLSRHVDELKGEI